MQTFLPYPDYAKSMAVLDPKRLGKQRVEAYQLLLQLCGVKMVDYPEWEPRRGRWKHPAVAMWAGHEINLLSYVEACCNEWTSRGYRDTCLEKSSYLLRLMREDDWTTEAPPWIGDEAVHRSHRANLVRKDPEFYGSVFKDIEPDATGEYLEYVWPRTSYNLEARFEQNYERAQELYAKRLSPSLARGGIALQGGEDVNMMKASITF